MFFSVFLGTELCVVQLGQHCAVALVRLTQAHEAGLGAENKKLSHAMSQDRESKAMRPGECTPWPTLWLIWTCQTAHQGCQGPIPPIGTGASVILGSPLFGDYGVFFVWGCQGIKRVWNGMQGKSWGIGGLCVSTSTAH